MNKSFMKLQVQLAVNQTCHTPYKHGLHEALMLSCSGHRQTGFSGSSGNLPAVRCVVHSQLL